MKRSLLFLFVLLPLFAATAQSSRPEGLWAYLFHVPVQRNILERPDDHKFFDGRNKQMLFINLGMQSLDAITTRHDAATFVDWRERSPLARPFENAGWPGTIVFHYGLNVAGTLGLQYLAHRTGHHRIEHWLPSLVIGQGAAGAITNLRFQGRRR